MNKVRRNKKGFTLVELIIVIAILAILAAVAVPSFIGLQAEAIRGKDIGNATAIVTAINAYNAMYPDAKIADTTAASTALVKAKDLWPRGMSATDETAALTRVTYTNGIAIATTT